MLYLFEREKYEDFNDFEREKHEDFNDIIYLLIGKVFGFVFAHFPFRIFFFAENWDFLL